MKKIKESTLFCKANIANIGQRTLVYHSLYTIPRIAVDHGLPCANGLVSMRDSQILCLKAPTGRAVCICHPIRPNLVDLHSTVNLCTSTKPRETLTVGPTI